MWRFVLPASVMVGALVVLLAGALGNLPTLPNLSAELPTVLAKRTVPEPAGPSAAAAAPQTSPGAPVQQPVADTLQRQVTELQAQIAQRSKELASLRSNEHDAHHELDTLRQQRQDEEAAVARLQSEQRQLAAAAPAVAAQQSTSVQQAANDALQRQAAELDAQIKQRSQELAALRTSEDQAHHELDTLRQQRQAEDTAVARLQSQQRGLATAKTAGASAQPRPQQLASQPESAPAQNTATQTTLPQLRANEPASQRVPEQLTQSAPIVSPRDALVTARQLLASGHAADARQLLVKAQAQSALHPVTPDQPVATGNNMAATRIGDAIRLLDAGDKGSALQAINVAMDSTSGAASVWPTYPQAPGSYAARPTYNYGNDTR